MNIKDIKQKTFEFFKVNYSLVKTFFAKEVKATKTELSKLDLAEIFIALLPMAIFGSLLFGFKAVFILLLSIVLCVGLDFLWDFVFKKQKKIDYSLAIVGLLSGLILTSSINIFLVILLNITLIVLRKTVFKNSKLQFTSSLLITRAVFAIIFFKAFSTYYIPFMEIKGVLPVDNAYMLSSFYYPAKSLFFGMHCGNIGDTSILLILIGGIYLIVRKIIHPVIPVSFIAAATVLALIFSRNVAISVFGGGIFFGAFFLTLDRSFSSDSLINKVLYGVFCAVLTFILRVVLKTEGVYLAILITDLIFLYINKNNINRVLCFVKKLDFKKALLKIKTVFSYK